MDIKNCAHCGGEAMLWHKNAAKYGYMVRCTICEMRTDNYQDKESAIDVWNGRYESDPGEADRWLKVATEQRDRADKAEAERDELKNSLAQAMRMMEYAGKMQ